MQQTPQHYMPIDKNTRAVYNKLTQLYDIKYKANKNNWMWFKESLSLEDLLKIYNTYFKPMKLEV